jgi:hypothetical protein
VLKTFFFKSVKLSKGADNFQFRADTLKFEQKTVKETADDNQSAIQDHF